MDTKRLMASFFTLAEGAYPWTDHDYSRVPFRERVELAGRIGFGGLGLWMPDILKTRETLSYGDMKLILDDNGITTIEVEWLLDWYTDGDARVESDKTRAVLLEAAEELNARDIKVADYNNSSAGFDRLVEELARLSDQAEERGTAILFEMLPAKFSKYATLESALGLVRAAGRRNCGLTLDLWHVEHNGISADEIVSLIRPDDLLGVEFCDGRRWPDEDLFEATVHRRLLPGDGEFDVTGFLSAFDALGYDGPLSVEVLNHVLREVPQATMTALVFESGRKALAAVEARK